MFSQVRPVPDKNPIRGPVRTAFRTVRHSVSSRVTVGDAVPGVRLRVALAHLHHCRPPVVGSGERAASRGVRGLGGCPAKFGVDAEPVQIVD